MQVGFRPNTALGKWSIILIVVSFIFFILLFSFIASGQRGGDTFFSRPALAVPMLLAGISAACAFFTGITCVIRNRERAIFVYISTIIGFFVLLFGFAEIIFPH
jgi:hypothetical protein